MYTSRLMVSNNCRKPYLLCGHVPTCTVVLANHWMYVIGAANHRIVQASVKVHCYDFSAESQPF